MSFATFWIEDTLPVIASLPGFTAGPAFDWMNSPRSITSLTVKSLTVE